MEASSPAAGLTAAEAAERLAQVGPNELAARAPVGAARLLRRQFESPLVLVLLAAAGLSAVLGETLDAIAITVIVSINALVGFAQEFRADRAMAALDDLTARRARVVRDGQVMLVAARGVVPGDLLVLEAGDIVAADAEVLASHELSTIEAVLTGESFPVAKVIGPPRVAAALAERTGDVFMGTQVATGTGRARVCATGGATEIGAIAETLRLQPQTTTPLEARIAALGRTLVWTCLCLVCGVAAIGLARGLPWLEILMVAISLAVAAVPEGLPAVVTIALAVGVHRMAARHVLVRRLASVETLGSATVICTDKTGTLTRGVMEVREVWGGPRSEVLAAAAAACDPQVSPDDLTGDPVELAILRASRAANIQPTATAIDHKPFDAANRHMVVFGDDGQRYVKGAMEVVAAMTHDNPPGIEQTHAAMARAGLRILAVAQGIPDRLRFVGLIGIADEPRPEALAAVKRARQAGVKVVMITGDHPDTAHTIAREMDIVRPGEDPSRVVFARATAADKLAIVRKLRARGEIVAMTGDGVNDAPAIHEGDIGIAMGRAATEVTREASDMILTNDDLGGIVHAIREGRVILANIRKTVVYLLGGNAAELLLVLVSVAAGFPLPLVPIQLLWLNLLGEPLPGIALALDPATHDVLDDAPRARHEPILGRAQWLEVIGAAVVLAGSSFGVYVWALEAFELGTARTLAFTTLVFGIIFRAFASRSSTHTFWERGPATNRALLAVVCASVALQLTILYLPSAARVFALTPLPPRALLLAFAVGLVPVTVLECFKWVRRASLWHRGVPAA